jgi:hypothetical protein
MPRTEQRTTDALADTSPEASSCSGGEQSMTIAGQCANTVSPAAERMRRHRQRRRDGLKCITIELCDPEIDELVNQGLLAHESRNDADEIRLALYKLFEQTLPT